MAIRRLLASCIAAAGVVAVSAQSTTPYTDPETGIAFQQYSNAAGFSFGIALPEEAGTDFIGQISATGTGWAGTTLTGSMRNSVLVVAWPNGDSILGSLRTTAGYSNPGPLGGDAVLKPIEDGISVNSTGFTYTFLCERCIVDGKAFDSSAESGVLGWALSNTAVTTPSSVSSALNYHDGGFGGFGLDIASARSAEFSRWAALASDNTTPVPTPPGNNDTSPTPPPVTNGTVPVSNQTYDYIVVGGGASGLVVSQRLAETGRSVLVLERGGPSFYSSGGTDVMPWNDTLTAYEVPAIFMMLSSFSGASAYCNDVPQVAGCVLGGGTAVNGLQFVRPPSFDFENWPAGWNWNEVEASAAKVYERNPGTLTPSTDGKYYDNAVYDVVSSFLGGAGWQYADSNEEPDRKVKVYSQPAVSTDAGLRAGPVRTYLPLAETLPNFTLKLHTKVVRAVRSNSTITGVEIEDEQGRSIVNVNRGGKVILAAGAMSSPRILFNSGIGPVEQVNIVKTGSTKVQLPPETAWINSPVGFVKDHAFIRVDFNVNGGMTVLPQSAFARPSSEMIDLYKTGAGPLAQAHFRAASFTTITNDDGHKTLIQTSFSSTANDTITAMFFTTHGLTSTGKLGITPEGNTIWTENPYLNSASDKKAMAAAIEEVLAISRQANSTLTYAGSANATGASIVAASVPQAGVHMIGTTIMGTDDGSKNGSSVVDLDCKVYGTDNLFVVDAGMHADVPTGNTQAIVMVAAEHAAKRIIALHTGNATTSAQRSSLESLRSATRRRSLHRV